jgi:hypothetical protein
VPSLSGAREAIARATLGALISRLLGVLIIGCAALTGWIVSGGAWRDLGDAQWPVAILVCSILAFGVVWFTNRRSIYTYRYPKVAFRYVVIQKTVKYEIDNNGVLRYSRTVHVKCRRDQIDDYVDRFIWTGGGGVMPGPGTNVSRVEPLLRVGIWTFYRAYLDRVLQKGEEYEFEVTWPPITNWRTSSPFVSSSTEEPTHEVRFILRLPAAEVGNKVLGETLRGVESTYPFKTEEFELDDGRYTWTIKRPGLYTHYRLRWEWQGEPLETVQAALEV